MKIYSTGQPQISAGVGETKQAALLAFLDNADTHGSYMRKVFGVIIEQAFGTSLDNAFAEFGEDKVIETLVKDGSYGDLHIDG